MATHPPNPYARPVSTCPSCGHELIRGRPRCTHCGQPVRGGAVGGGARGGAAFGRPLLISVLAVLYFIGAGFMLLPAPFFAYLGVAEPDATPIAAMAILFAFLGIIYLVAGIGLWKLKSYGRTIAVVLSGIGLLGFPVGTLISALILVYLFKPGIKILFSERSPGQLSPYELGELQKVQSTSGAGAVLIVVILLFVVVGGIGVVAAIAIPSLLRARVSANEAMAIGDIRTMISAQQVYASSNGGFFDDETCLMAPAGCIPGYPETSPNFLGEPLSGAKSGYERTLHLGPPAEGDATNRSPSSVTTYAFVAVPSQPGVTGSRAFCGDSSGMICTVPSGAMPTVTEGRCDISMCESF